MPVSDVTIYQDNVSGAVNIMAVHSPLVFLIDVTYTGAAPTLLCDVTIDGVNPISEDATFQCVFHSDQSPTVRRFMFRADSLLRGFMEDFEDFVQTAEAVSEVYKTKQDFTLVFYDSLEAASDSLDIIAFAARRQFGQTPAITEIYNNQDALYIAGKDKPVYVYFFNTVAGDDITITDGTTTYHLAAGGETVLLTDEMTLWDGTGNETSPKNWVIYSSRPRSATWRIYEQSAGIAEWIMTGALIGNYFALRNDTVTWTKGEEVWLRIKYKGGSANTYLGAVERALYGTSVAGAINLKLPYSADYVELEAKFFTFTADWLLPGPRCPFIVLTCTANEDINVFIDTITIFKPTTKGYYRLKVTDLDVDTTYQLKNGATVLATKVVRVKPFCTGYQYLKYLDRNGQYRFFPFNNRYQTKDAPKLIGKINQLVTNIYSDQGDSKNVGYTNERKMTLVADDVYADELDILSDIWNSPRVYLQVGTGDTAVDWVRVTVSASDATTRRRKGNSGKVEITVTLPEWYNITML